MNEAPRNKLSLSVVVGSHNARTSVRDCLDSISRQRNEHDTEIVVVDNSTDGTAEIVNAEFPCIELIPAPASALGKSLVLGRGSLAAHP